MGQGIAITCAAAGLDVLLLERSPELARQSVEEIGHALDRDIAKWRRTESEKKAVLSRVPKGTEELNKKALTAGYELAKAKARAN